MPSYGAALKCVQYNSFVISSFFDWFAHLSFRIDTLTYISVYIYMFFALKLLDYIKIYKETKLLAVT